MYKMKNIKNIAILVLGIVGICQIQSCKEDIDMSDRYTFTEWTVSSYLEEHLDTYGEYYNLLGKVKINDKYESTVLQLMGARGNYTVFAPTNQAIYEYLDSLCKKGIIAEPSWEGFKSEKTLDSIQKVIVYNSIIDGKDNNNAYQTSSFPDDTKEFSLPNMYDRKLTVHYDQVNPDSVFINATKDDKGKIISGSLIDLKNRDIVAINGCIHCVHSVVAPSNATLGDFLRDFVDLNDPDYSIIANLILACGLQDTLSQVKDEDYEQKIKDGNVEPTPTSQSLNEKKPVDAAEHRKYGFTIFAETNAFWEKTLGKPASEITLEDVKDWVISKGFYPDAKDNGNYADEDNVLNQFITYHILPMRIPVDKLVIHVNELGYNYDPSSTPHTIPVWEIYTTMGKRRLLKIYEGNRTAPKGIFLNRFPNLNNERRGNYWEKSCDEDKQGILINTAEAKNIINGYIYPIDDVLVYDQNTRDNFQKQRMRFDVASFFPELMNNDIRYNLTKKQKEGYVGMPCDKSATGYKYLENVEIIEGSYFLYLSGIDFYWNNYQADEFNVRGKNGAYEMIFTLPPVPAKDIYEIRYAVQNNSDNRSMCQVYFGDNKDRMPAIGIPLDLRIGGKSPLLNWQTEDPTDDEVNAENDKKMRNNGFMKGAKCYHVGKDIQASARAEKTTTRRIIVRQEMDPNKTYYLKFKSVLGQEDKEFYMDYIEFCSKAVYDNPETPEDIW